MTIANSPRTPAASCHLMTAADVPALLRALGDIPPERLILNPLPGTATEADVIRLVEGDDKVLCELVDRTLVEKPVGFHEARIAAAIIVALGTFVRDHRLGIVAGADAMLQMTGGNVRLPDVTFVAWADLPGGKLPREAIGRFPATLAVEVLSPSNSKTEMRRKRQEYFASGTKLVWEFDLKLRSVSIFTAPEEVQTLGTDGALEGGNILPGFVLPLATFFEELDLAQP